MTDSSGNAKTDAFFAERNWAGDGHGRRAVAAGASGGDLHGDVKLSGAFDILKLNEQQPIYLVELRQT